MSVRRYEYSEETLSSHHQHVDNGGLTMSVVRHTENNEDEGCPILRITDSYFGYSEHILEFREVQPDHLRKFAEALMLAAHALEARDTER